MQVPAYVPREEGVHVLEKRGVSWLLLKTMAIDMDEEDEESPIPDMPDMLLPIPISMFVKGA